MTGESLLPDGPVPPVLRVGLVRESATGPSRHSDVSDQTRDPECDAHQTKVDRYRPAVVRERGDSRCREHVAVAHVQGDIVVQLARTAHLPACVVGRVEELPCEQTPDNRTDEHHQVPPARRPPPLLTR